MGAGSWCQSESAPPLARRSWPPRPSACSPAPLPGGGKSLTFQLAPLYRNQITVVITPLLALAKDQVGAAPR